MKTKLLVVMMAIFFLGYHTHAQNPELVLDNVSYMAVNNGHLFLHAGNYQTGTQGLWITDGTTQGSQLLKPLYLNASASYAQFNGKTYFMADNGSDGTALWVTDGTVSGTTLVKDLDLRPSYSDNMVSFNNHLFFSGYDATNGKELWISDGTESGTHLFKDIWSGSQDGLYYYETMKVYQNKLYFSATDVADNYEVWVTDGTTAGTLLFKDINPSGSSSPSSFNIIENKLYFSATADNDQRGLWVTDGTAAGTILVKDIPVSANSYGPSRTEEYNGKAYFAVLKNTPPHELWSTDGTVSGTTLIEENTGATTAVFNGELYFSKKSGTNYALYKTTGAPGSGSLVKVLEGGNSNRNPFGFTLANERLYFFCTYDESGANYIAADLWETDGTTANTKLVEDSSGNSVEAYNKVPLTSYNTELFFVDLYRDLYKIGNPTVSVSDIPTEATIRLFPNPVNQHLTIKIDESLIGSQFEILNITGQSLKSGELSDLFNTIDVEDLSAGTYFVRVQSESVKSSSSFIKK